MVSGPIIYSSLIQDSDDEDGEDGAGEDGESGRRLEFGGRTSPVQEDQSEPEMTEEEKEFQLVCSHNPLSLHSHS